MKARNRVLSISVYVSLGAALAATAAPPAGEEVLTIDGIVAQVLAENPELAIYETEIEAARGERHQTTRWENPEFSLEIGHKRVSGAGSAEGTAWAASVAQPIEFPGRRALRKAIAERNVELAEIGLEHFKTLLAARVRSLSHSLFAARANAEATDVAAGRAMELTETALQRETGGISPLLESRMLEGSALTLQQRRLAARRAYQEALIELNQLRDAAAETPIRLAEPQFEFTELPAVEDLLARAWTHGFEAQVKRVELEQQGFRVRLARKDRFPSITVAPFVSQETTGERETVAGLGVSFPLPIWDGEAGNVSAAEARLRQADASLLILRRDLERRVVGRALAYRAATETLENLREGVVEEFAEAADLAERHYRLGAIPINTYLEMQTTYLDALEAWLDMREQALGHWLELEVLIGEMDTEETK